MRRRRCTSRSSWSRISGAAQSRPMTRIFMGSVDRGSSGVGAREQGGALHLGSGRDAERRQDGWGEIDQGGAFGPKRPAEEQHTGHQAGIDDMVSAPLFHVVLELPLRNSSQRGSPGGPVSGSEANYQ